MGVLDSIIQLKKLDAEKTQANVNAFLTGMQQAQEMRKVNLLQELEQKKLGLEEKQLGMTQEDIDIKKQGQETDLLKIGLQRDPLTGKVVPVSPEMIESIKKVKENEYTDLLKSLQIEKTQLEIEDKKSKTEVIDALNKAENLPDTATPEQKTEWLTKLPDIAQETIKGLTDYTYDPSKFASLRSDERTKYLALAKKYDPNFNMMEFGVRQNYMLQIKNPSSAAGRNILSLNTIAHHLNQLDEELDSLRGTNVKPVNAIINWASEMTGDPGITDVKIAYKIVKDELERALAGTVTQEALRDFDKVLNPNLGIDAQKNAVKTMVKVVRGRIQPYRDQFKSVIKRDEAGELISPESQMLFEKYMPSINKTSVTTTKGVLGNIDINSLSPESKVRLLEAIRKEKATRVK